MIRPLSAAGVHPRRPESGIDGSYNIYFGMVSNVNHLARLDPRCLHGIVKYRLRRFGYAHINSCYDVVEVLPYADCFQICISVGHRDDPEVGRQFCQYRYHIRKQLHSIARGIEDRKCILYEIGLVTDCLCHLRQDHFSDTPEIMCITVMSIDDVIAQRH